MLVPNLDPQNSPLATYYSTLKLQSKSNPTVAHPQKPTKTSRPLFPNIPPIFPTIIPVLKEVAAAYVSNIPDKVAALNSNPTTQALSLKEQIRHSGGAYRLLTIGGASRVFYVEAASESFARSHALFKNMIPDTALTNSAIVKDTIASIGATGVETVATYSLWQAMRAAQQRSITITSTEWLHTVRQSISHPWNQKSAFFTGNFVSNCTSVPLMLAVHRILIEKTDNSNLAFYGAWASYSSYNVLIMAPTRAIAQEGFRTFARSPRLMGPVVLCAGNLLREGYYGHRLTDAMLGKN